MNSKATATRGRPKAPLPRTGEIAKVIIRFLQAFMPETLARRLVCALLLATDMQEATVAEAAGLGIRTVWTVRMAISNEDFDSLFTVGHGSGRARKTRGLEDAIMEELDKGNYHTRQQVADMIFEKFGIRISVSAVGKLLKKTASSA